MTRLDDLHALSRSYRFERELGQGGMATVYLVHDLKHDRDVALKVLRWAGYILWPSRFSRPILRILLTTGCTGSPPC